MYSSVDMEMPDSAQSALLQLSKFCGRSDILDIQTVLIELPHFFRRKCFVINV